MFIFVTLQFMVHIFVFRVVGGWFIKNEANYSKFKNCWFVGWLFVQSSTILCSSLYELTQGAQPKNYLYFRWFFSEIHVLWLLYYINEMSNIIDVLTLVLFRKFVDEGAKSQILLLKCRWRKPLKFFSFFDVSHTTVIFVIFPLFKSFK